LHHSNFVLRLKIEAVGRTDGCVGVISLCHGVVKKW
jgi:hypothetical protein